MLNFSPRSFAAQKQRVNRENQQNEIFQKKKYIIKEWKLEEKMVYYFLKKFCRRSNPCGAGHEKEMKNVRTRLREV